MSVSEGTLYIVATPIGNLDDISARALEVLRSVDVIYAEDTRHSSKLLQHYGIASKTRSLHEHNEQQRIPGAVDDLQAGRTAAVIADAGTPLISDPGFRLVVACHDQQVRVSPVPGPAALVAALCVSGLATDSFVYLGFPPAKAAARREWLAARSQENRTQILYESRHRIKATLSALADTFGAERRATVARELTKTHETVRRDTLDNLVTWIESDTNQQKGEFVLVVEGHPETATSDRELDRILSVLLGELTVKQSVVIATRLTGLPHRQVYDAALA
ncbi:MAG: 16S rRNA (cytidine(1402)-2'-O)-methyltransferase, partial [Gammaproteobacteria bacterium]|nr:16S rRNA (cytidine(1402)-2'-O)-methyltransferase [Gammaproteobacteria bacterium]